MSTTPRKTTKDAWLDQFADWTAETQENVMEMLEFIHRQTKRREAKQPAKDGAKDAQPVAGLLDRQTEAEAIR